MQAFATGPPQPPSTPPPPPFPLFTPSTHTHTPPPPQPPNHPPHTHRCTCRTATLTTSWCAPSRCPPRTPTPPRCSTGSSRVGGWLAGWVPLAGACAGTSNYWWGVGGWLDGGSAPPLVPACAAAAVQTRDLSVRPALCCHWAGRPCCQSAPLQGSAAGRLCCAAAALGCCAFTGLRRALLAVSSAPACACRCCSPMLGRSRCCARAHIGCSLCACSPGRGDEPAAGPASGHPNVPAVGGEGAQGSGVVGGGPPCSPTPRQARSRPAGALLPLQAQTATLSCTAAGGLPGAARRHSVHSPW